MTNDKATNIIRWLWPKDPDHLPVWDRMLRHVCRFLYIFFKEFKRDRISLRASALTYSIVLSLVPMLALSTAVLKGMGAGDQMRQAAYRLIDNLSDQLPPTAGTAAEKSGDKASAPSAATDRLPAATAGSQIEEKDFTGHLYDAVDKVFDYVDRTNFAALGMIGTFLLLVAVLIVINGIEEAMNAIWKVEQSRSPARKIMNYMALLIICPLTVNLGIGATTMLNTPSIARYLDTLIPLAWLQGLLFKLIPLFLLTLTFVLLYLFLPNTRVRARAAWIGGATAAIGLMALQKIFILLQVGVANYNAIYGSFATVPLFLLWLHSAWLVFFLGAEVTFTTQHYRNYHPNGHHLPPGDEMAVILDIIREIYRHFEQRRALSLERLADVTRESSVIVERILKRLVRAGLVRVSDEQPETYLPATSAERLEAEEVCAMFWGRELQSVDSAGRRMADTFFTAGVQALPRHPWKE
ncbi:MAG: YihY family inner membrane protein [Deltaproteobacteria bacterium]|nr:YihY family inner membrane protein [Deltaproteobacteria bacterium]